MMAAQGAGGGTPKADAVEKPSKGGCMKMQPRSEKFCTHHMYVHSPLCGSYLREEIIFTPKFEKMQALVIGERLMCFLPQQPEKKGLDHAVWVVTALHHSLQVLNANQFASRLDYAVRDYTVADGFLLHEDPSM